MAQLSPDQLDDILERASARVLYQPNTGQRELDPRLALLHELNAELAKGGNAGTHAYDMMAAVEDINAGQTRVLIELIAAVVLWHANGQDFVRSEVTFQPGDIDDMQRAYDIDVNRHGMQVTVTLTRKPDLTKSWQLDEGEDGVGAREQAEKPPERPVWAIRTFSGALVGCEDRDDAEEKLHRYHREDMMAAIENRFCLHETCPSTGCNQAEVTSDA